MPDLAYIIGGLILIVFIGAMSFELFKVGVVRAFGLLTTLVVIVAVTPAAMAAERAIRIVNNVTSETDHGEVERIREALIKDMKVSAKSFRQYPAETMTAHAVAAKMAG